MLIEEGKKALGREVVVMSDAQEDEVDDGSGSWEEEDANEGTSTTTSPRKSKPRNIPIPPPGYISHPPSASPRSSRFEVHASTSLPTIRRHTHHSRGVSIESVAATSLSPSLSLSTSFKEDESAWESPELRESMAKARERLLQNRA